MAEMNDEIREEAEIQPSPVVNTDYLTEEIKRRPVNRKKLFRRMVITALLAVLFGTVACAAFWLLSPRINALINPQEEPAPVTILHKPADNTALMEKIGQEETAKPAAAKTEAVQDAVPDSALSASEPAVTEQDPALLPETAAAGAPAAGTAAAAAGAGTGTSGSFASMLINEAMLARSFEGIYESLRETAETAERSMTTVTEITEEYNWFNESFVSTGLTTGTIVAITDDEILVLSGGRDLAEAGELRVTFYDGTVSPAVVKAADKNTGCAVLSVKLKQIPAGIRRRLSPIELGVSSGNTLVGRPVIAIGAPTGEIGSVAYGMVTGSTQLIDLPDSRYRRITTDIYTSRLASGILIDLHGRMVGLVNLSFNDTSLANVLSAIGVSELVDLIEQLSNGKTIPELGIYGADVTELAEREMDVPRGAFIRQVEVDSPAMEAGLRGGDVIVRFNRKDIGSYGDLIEALKDCRSGSDVPVTVMRPGTDSYREVRLNVKPE